MIERGKDIVPEDSSKIDKPIKYEGQSDKSQLFKKIK